MYELYPYLTNDGTVGLFSPEDDDIYHSTYGALSESWEKFILPAGLKHYIEEHDSVKILDICYGIGYNTKAALNVFLNSATKNEKILSKKYKITSPINLNIASIDTDNISSRIAGNFDENFYKKNIKLEQEIHDSSISNAAIDSDNILGQNVYINPACKKILIDAIDSDKILIGISPFIISSPLDKLFSKNSSINEFKNNNLNISNNFKMTQLLKLKNNKSQKNPKYNFIKNEYKLLKEVSIILLEKLLNQSKKNSDIINNKILHNILNKKIYFPYFDKFMLNLARFYQNRGYNVTSDLNNSTFLHNIYYQYLSKSYKNAKKLLNNNKIDINFHSADARNYVKSTTERYNFIFLDAFTPSKCPCLWTLDFFRELYDKLEDDGMILTYSNSAAIRNAFMQAGFYVGKSYDNVLNKNIGTVATKDINLIQTNLNQQELDLINSRAGICYRDVNLDLPNSAIIFNRAAEVENSELISSSQVLKGAKKNG